MKWLRHKYTPCLPLGPDGRRISGCREHIALSRAAAAESIVLLKNENDMLPLKKGKKIVLLGKASEEYIKGGGGSGDVTVAYVRSLYDSMLEKQSEGKVELYTGLHDFYSENVRLQHEAGREPGMTQEPTLSEEQLQLAAAFSDTAILSVCRFSGEGWDRKSEEAAKLGATENTSWETEIALRESGNRIFSRGDFFLADGEQVLFESAKKYFANIIVVLNVGGMVDTSWFSGDDSVKAALFAGQGGMEGAMACGDILCGDVCPSGKLVDTFAGRLADYPSTAGFHESADYVEYTEDIYVGYRYFETIPGQKEKVIYPFGYGLSYTAFDNRVVTAKLDGDALVCEVQVKNIGKTSGKQIIQLYFRAPAGKLGKPAMQMIAFEKTGLLGENQIEQISLSVPLSQLASYDDSGVVCKSAWVLEQGTYQFFVGTSVRDTQELPVSYCVDQDTVVSQLTQKLKPSKLSRRMLQDGSFETLACTEYDAIVRPENFADPQSLEGIVPETRFEERSSFRGMFEPEDTQLISVAEGKMLMDDFLNTLTLDEKIYLLGGQPNTGVANTFGFGNNKTHGIPSVMTADGPAGLRIRPEVGVYTTAWPCATSLACTWNRELVRAIGKAAALEVKENNIGVWLAPAMNIHRSPLCGRNFEYYSEDPLIAGEMGAAIISGIQSQGVAATPKHFAFNNKETNRKHSDSRVSERAAREIYLKGFEIAVKKADPWVIMSSYNMVNGKYTSENRELLTDILRGEWGFNGAVTTDWWTRAEHWREVKAGNDIKMANGFPEQVKAAVEDGRLSEEEVQICARRVCELMLKLD